MWRKLHRGVETVFARVALAESLGTYNIKTGKSEFFCLLAPGKNGLLHFGNDVRPIHDEQRFAVDLDIARIVHEGAQIIKHGTRILDRMLLSDQDVMILPIPAPRPVLVGPDHAEGNIQFWIVEHLLQRKVHQNLSGKPIEIIGKTRYTIFFSKFGLFLHHLQNAQVIVSQMNRAVWLMMSLKQGLGLADIGPFGKAFSPPAIIFSKGMKLRQIKCNRPWDGLYRDRCLIGDERFAYVRICHAGYGWVVAVEGNL